MEKRIKKGTIAFLIAAWFGFPAVFSMAASAANPETPTALPGGGTFTGAQEIVLTAENGAKIYYTLDDSTPSRVSALYTGAIPINADTVLKAIAVKGNKTSDLLNEQYFIVPDPDPTPEPDPTPTPSPEPTPVPSATPDTTLSPEPTPNPTSEPSPVASSSPAPEPTPEPPPLPSPATEPTPTTFPIIPVAVSLEPAASDDRHNSEENVNSEEAEQKTAETSINVKQAKTSRKKPEIKTVLDDRKPTVIAHLIVPLSRVQIINPAINEGPKTNASREPAKEVTENNPVQKEKGNVAGIFFSNLSSIAEAKEDIEGHPAGKAINILSIVDRVIIIGLIAALIIFIVSAFYIAHLSRSHSKFFRACLAIPFKKRKKLYDHFNKHAPRKKNGEIMTPYSQWKNYADLERVCAVCIFGFTATKILVALFATGIYFIF